ncbi:MAG: hypothetical protein WD939_01985 [Dehalococcoidia bacterium]
MSTARDDVWAITTFFNPIGFENRLTNYRVFRERLNVPLLAVEASFGGEFQLTRDDADILVQVKGGDVMWQKERLLNIGLDRVPGESGAVAWVDCDVLMERPDWLEQAIARLDDYVLVQPFHRSFRLPPGVLPEEFDGVSAKPRFPIAYHLSTGALTTEALREWSLNGDKPNDGLAWVGRRDVMMKHRFYDAQVVGGGTRNLAHAAVGEHDALIAGRRVSPRHAEHYLAWAREFYETVQRRVGYVRGTLYHLWHGDEAHRYGVVRHERFAEFDFDPTTDIALDEDGCWRWNSDKVEMHAYLKEFLAARREDGENGPGPTGRPAS